MPSELERLFDPVPGDLTAYFVALAAEPEPGLLDPGRAAELSREFRDFHPVARALGGVVLDDFGTSDHHVYLSLPPVAGMVLHLAHDDDTRIVFASLDAYLAAARSARESDGWISDLHPDASPLAADPPALGAFIRQLLQRDDDDAASVILALIPSLDLRMADAELLARLASHEDFYLGERVANEIARRPVPGLMEAARLCAAHPHPQVSGPGARAVRAVAAAR